MGGGGGKGEGVGGDKKTAKKSLVLVGGCNKPPRWSLQREVGRGRGGRGCENEVFEAYGFKNWYFSIVVKIVYEYLQYYR
jgi:hypothetical protein